jgi:hypothetical protein
MSLGSCRIAGMLPARSLLAALVLAGLSWASLLAGPQAALAASKTSVIRAEGVTVTVDIDKKATTAVECRPKAKPKPMARKATPPRRQTARRSAHPSATMPAEASFHRRRVLVQEVRYDFPEISYNLYAIPPAPRRTAPDWKMLW